MELTKEQRENPVGDARTKYLKNTFLSDMTPEQAESTLNFYQNDPDRIARTYRSNEAYDGLKREKVLDASKKYPDMDNLIGDLPASILTTEYIDDVTRTAKINKEYNDTLNSIKESEVGFGGTISDFYERRNLEDRKQKSIVLSQREGLSIEEIQSEHDIINLIDKRLNSIPNPTKDSWNFNLAKGIGDLAASSDKAALAGTLGLINPALGLFAAGLTMADEANYRFAGRYLIENPEATAEEALDAVQLPAVRNAAYETALMQFGGGVGGALFKPIKNIAGKGGGKNLSKILNKTKAGKKVAEFLDNTWAGKLLGGTVAGFTGEATEEIVQAWDEEAFFDTYKTDKSTLATALQYAGVDIANFFSGEELNERNKQIAEMIRTSGGAMALFGTFGGGLDKVSSNQSDWVKDKQKAFNERLQNNDKFKKAMTDFKETIDGSKAPDVFKKQMMQELTKDGKTYLTAQKIVDLKALAESKLSAEKLERFNKAYTSFAEEQNIEAKLESGEKIDTPIADFIEMFGLDEELYQSALDGSSPTATTDSTNELKAEKTSVWDVESDVESYAKITDSVINMKRFESLTREEKASVSGALITNFESTRKMLKDGQDLTTESFIETNIPKFDESKKNSKDKAVFNRVKNLISLYKTGDISSIFHENNHATFSTMEKAYFENNLVDEYKGVYEGVRKGLGETDLTKPLSTKGQEDLSKMFEKYMATGKAPNKSMQKMFSDIKNLMLKIYGSLNAITDLDIKPEIKEYFDSMFAANLQVQTAESNSRLSPISKPEKMSDEDYQDYLLTVDKARIDETTATKKDSDKREQMRNNPGMQNYKETQKRQFIEKLEEQSVYKAQGFMLENKINSKYIKDNNITDINPNYVSETGKLGTNLEMDIDTVSGSLGYASSLEMITDATTIDTLEQSAERFANEQVDIKIDEKLGVLHQDIPYLSQSNKYRLKQLVIESGVENVEVKMKEIIAKVNNYMSRITSKDAADYKNTYDTFVKKNDQARAAYLRNDDVLASKLFEEAAYNSVLMEAKKEARNNLEELQEKIKFLNEAKNVTIEKIGKENHNFLIDLLYNWRFIDNNSGTGLTVEKQVDNWVERIPSGMFFDKKMVSQNKEFLVNGTQKKYRDIEKQIENMKYKDAEFFSILVDGIEQTSRVNESLKTINLDEAQRNVREAAMEEFMSKKGKIKKVTTEKQKLGWLKKFYAGQLDSTETFFNNLFGEKVAMLYVRPYFRAIENAENEYAEIKKTMGNIYIKHGKDKGGLTVDRKLMIPELGMAISEQTMLEIALNNGNSFNRDNIKLTLKQTVEQEQGRVINITDNNYNSILNQIDKVYFDIAEDFSKLLGDYWQSTKDNYHKLTGNQLTAVLGEEFTVHGKNYKGWYYPATKIEIRPHAEMEAVLGAEDMMKSLINSSHLNERSSVVTGNLDLTNSNLMKHLHNVVLFKYVAEPYRDLSNFLKESKSDISSVAGDFRYNSMVKWFNNSLKPDSIDTPLFAQMEKIYKMAILSWKYSTALIQLTAFVGAAPQVGMRNLRRAATKQLTNPAEFSFNSIANKSPALKARWEHIEEAAFDMIHNPHKTKQSKYDIFMKAGFFPLAYLDLIAANIAWEAANIQAKEELLYNTEQASLYADSVVRTSQGDFSYYSKPEIAKGWSRLFVPFMTYFLASGSNLRAAYSDKNTMKVASYLVALGIVVPALESMIKEPLKDDDDEFNFTESWLDNSIGTLSTALIPIPMISKLPINSFKTIIATVNPDINVNPRYYSNEIPLQKAMSKVSRGIDSALEAGLNQAGFKTKRSAAESAFKSLENFGDITLPNDLMKEMVKPYFKDLTK